MSKQLNEAIDLQLAGDGSSLRDFARNLEDKNERLTELVNNMLPHINHTLERGRYRELLRRITTT